MIYCVFCGLGLPVEAKYCFRCGKKVSEETLEAGLNRLFGGSSGQQAKPAPETVEENSLKHAAEAYDAAIRAQRDGDWTRYGEEIKKLGEILNELRQ